LVTVALPHFGYQVGKILQPGTAFNLKMPISWSGVKIPYEDYSQYGDNFTNYRMVNVQKMMTSDYLNKAKALGWDMYRTMYWGGSITVPENFTVPAYEFVPWVSQEEKGNLVRKLRSQ
jgi:hypothetical protein